MTAQSTLGQIVADHPDLGWILENWGLDYCCGGGQTLEEAAQAKGLDPRTILALLEGKIGKKPPVQREGDSDNPATYDTPRLISHIKFIHHNYLRQQLPEMAALADKVARAHGAKNPDLRELKTHFDRLAVELLAHIDVEETLVFPQLARAAGPGPETHQLIVQLRAEHEDAGAALVRLRALAGDYVLPTWACPTSAALMTQLAAFEADMHTHVHLENNVLFGRF